jgi:leucyl/phenylalanyl-tRNA--protein transferase
MTDWFSRPRPLGVSHWRFPPPSDWPSDDVIAAGADLQPATLVAAYRRGLFPMPLPIARPVCAWWSPDPRGILPLDRLRITRSMRQSAKRFEVRVDTCFIEVIRACGNPARDGAWISEEFVSAFSRLHDLGWAHSIEVFDRAGELAGGLYGVRVNGVFAGESMFHRQRDTSKVALMALVQLMRESGMTLLDVQWLTDHLASLGAIEVSRHDYLRLLRGSLETAVLEEAD